MGDGGLSARVLGVCQGAALAELGGAVDQGEGLGSGFAALAFGVGGYEGGAVGLLVSC